MNATDRRPDIDQATRDELQPPCDIPVLQPFGHCPKAAAWITWFERAGRVISPKLLSCNHHKQHTEKHLAHCPGHPGVKLGSEPLR